MSQLDGDMYQVLPFSQSFLLHFFQVHDFDGVDFVPFHVSCLEHLTKSTLTDLRQDGVSLMIEHGLCFGVDHFPFLWSDARQENGMFDTEAQVQQSTSSPRRSRGAKSMHREMKSINFADQLCFKTILFIELKWMLKQLLTRVK